jgi:hypothetical protein
MTRTEAIAAGLNRFTSTTVCLRGHLSQRFVHNWRCVECSRKDTEHRRALTMIWTEERCNVVVAAYARGDSLEHIAEMLNTSRGAIAGKAKRLGLHAVRTTAPSKKPPKATQTALISASASRFVRYVHKAPTKPVLPAAVSARRANAVSRTPPKYRLNHGVLVCQWDNCEAAAARGSYCLEHGALVYRSIA